VKFTLKTPLLITIAIGSGVLVLAGYFIELPVLVDLRNLLLEWALILTAVALFVGVLNLLQVHWGKLKARQKGYPYSIVLIFSLVLTVVVVGIYGPTSQPSLWIFNYLLLPVETSLMAILAVVLVYAAARLLRRRPTTFTLIFIVTVLFILMGTLSIPGLEIPFVSELRAWITQVWATAGARGILLGVALGAAATGLRILTGSDRPYGG
jgi:hypothetical protein